MKGALERSCYHLSWHHIFGAVLYVFQDNQRRESNPGAFEAKSDDWAINSVLRDELYQRVRQRWCFLAGHNHTYFPYSVDGVARMYFRLRKRNAEEIEGFASEIAAKETQ